MAEFYRSDCDFPAVVLTICCNYLGTEASCRNQGRRHHFGENRNPVMTTFDKREEAFENKFVHDEELKFKAEARRNKLLGLWVAEKLGLSGEASNDYARTVVAIFGDGGDAVVIRKVIDDLSVKGITLTEAQVRVKMDELMAQAIAQVKAGA
jgi:hypothetical protein